MTVTNLHMLNENTGERNAGNPRVCRPGSVGIRAGRERGGLVVYWSHNLHASVGSLTFPRSLITLGRV